jgi:hypothetical protein
MIHLGGQINVSISRKGIDAKSVRQTSYRMLQQDLIELNQS